MFSKRVFRRRNKPGKSNFFEGGEKQQEQLFIPPVQMKLNINEPGDKFEEEADLIADNVADGPKNIGSIQKEEAIEEEVQAKTLRNEITPLVQRQRLPDEEESIQTKEEEEELQTKTLGSEISPLVQRQSIPQEEEEPIQAKEEEEEEVQRKPQDKPKENGELSGKLKQQRGAGNFMDPDTRVRMESAFGMDFSGVRIHSDSASHEMNEELNSQAFTNGKNIYFRSGNYRPDTRSGKQLLVHELVHTIQQGAVNSGKSRSSISHSQPVQRKEIPYQALSWDHFDGTPAEGAAFDACTFSGVKYYDGNVIDPAWNWNGKEVAVSINYKASRADLKAFMETDESWKRAWLTDDAAAKKKFGPDADIEAEREKLLAHEQIHFRISKSIAEKYRPKLKALIPPKTYTESAEAKSEDAARAFFEKVVDRKASELSTEIKKLLDAANNEKSLIQEIYDTDTNHSQIEDKQKSWENDYEKTFKEAVKRAKKKKEKKAH